MQNENHTSNQLVTIWYIQQFPSNDFAHTKFTFMQNRHDVHKNLISIHSFIHFLCDLMIRQFKIKREHFYIPFHFVRAMYICIAFYSSRACILDRSSRPYGLQRGKRDEEKLPAAIKIYHRKFWVITYDHNAQSLWTEKWVTCST